MPRIDLTAAESAAPSRPLWPLCLASLGTLAAWPLYLALLDVPLIRSTALPMFLLTGAGAVAGALYARWDDRTWVRLAGSANVLALLLVAAWFFWLASLPAADPKAAALTHAPDFSLPDQRGRPVSLSELNRGGPVLLLFYRGSWCPFCVSELRGLRSIQDNLKAAGVRVIAVSVDPPHKSEQAAERLELNFPLLSDAERRVITEYGIVDRGGGPDGEDIPIPAQFLIDADGRIAWRRIAGRVQDRADPQEVLRVVRDSVGRT